jgi:hypothetical protein
MMQASNVLVSDSVRCVLCDFGQSDMKSEAYRLSGTPLPRKSAADSLLNSCSLLTAGPI